MSSLATITGCGRLLRIRRWVARGWLAMGSRSCIACSMLGNKPTMTHGGVSCLCSTVLRGLVSPSDASSASCWVNLVGGNGPTHVVNGPHVMAQGPICKYYIHQGAWGKLPPPPL